MNIRRSEDRSASSWGYVTARIRHLAKGEALTVKGAPGETLVLIAGALMLDRPGREPELILVGDQGPIRLDLGDQGGHVTAMSPAQLAHYSATEER